MILCELGKEACSHEDGILSAGRVMDLNLDPVETLYIVLELALQIESFELSLETR